MSDVERSARQIMDEALKAVEAVARHVESQVSTSPAPRERPPTESLPREGPATAEDFLFLGMNAPIINYFPPQPYPWA